MPALALTTRAEGVVFCPMGLVLYTACQSRGFVCEWLLEELGTAYEAVRLNLAAGEAKTPAYRSIHPLGAVPALVVDGIPMVESLAICLYLADISKAKELAPSPTNPERQEYLQWMVYAVATIEPMLSKPFVRSLGVEPSLRPGVATDEERASFASVLAPLRERMGSGHMLPSGFSAADVLVASQLYWASQVGLLAGVEDARDYLASMLSRPACVKALEHDGSQEQ